MTIDPALIGNWRPKGSLAPFRTYRVDSDGRYFIADPESVFSFENGGQTLNWDGVTYTKSLGVPGVLEGVWVAVSGGEEWHFRADGTVTVHWSPTEEYFGSYETRNGGSDLWYEEFRSVISTNGPNLVFDPPYQSEDSYLYELNEPIWVLNDQTTGNTIFEYERV